MNSYNYKLDLIKEYDRLSNFLNDNNYKSAFNNFKDGKTAILMTDDFNIYNILQIRNLYGKSPNESVYKVSQDRKNFELPEIYENLVKDTRLNPQQSKKIADYVQVPRIKPIIPIEEQIKNKYGNLDPGILKYIEDLKLK